MTVYVLPGMMNRYYVSLMTWRHVHHTLLRMMDMMYLRNCISLLGLRAGEASLRALSNYVCGLFYQDGPPGPRTARPRTRARRNKSIFRVIVVSAMWWMMFIVGSYWTTWATWRVRVTGFWHLLSVPWSSRYDRCWHLLPVPWSSRYDGCWHLLPVKWSSGYDGNILVWLRRSSVGRNNRGALSDESRRWWGEASRDHCTGDDTSIRLNMRLRHLHG